VSGIVRLDRKCRWRDASWLCNHLRLDALDCAAANTEFGSDFEDPLLPSVNAFRTAASFLPLSFGRPKGFPDLVPYSRARPILMPSFVAGYLARSLTNVTLLGPASEARASLSATSATAREGAPVRRLRCPRCRGRQH
jgi:hypothetical protein